VSGRRARVVVAVLLALGLAAGGLAVALGGSSTTPTTSDAPVPDPTPTSLAGQWRADALSDFKPVNAVIVGTIQALEGWRSGAVSAKDVAATLTGAIPAVRETRTALARRTPLFQAPQALTDFRLAADLYLESLELARIGAVSSAKGDLLTQLQLTSTRLRTLADRVFDQAGAELEPYDPRQREVDGVVVQRPAEVPDWEAISLGAGPPLDVAPTPASPRARETARPQVPLSSWRSSFAVLAVPSGTTEAAALRSGEVSELRDLARALVAGSDGLRLLPDPEGRRTDSTRVQLALLVHAEAARVGQLAALLPSSRSALLTTARSVAAIGDALWTTLLPERSTGFTKRS